jgi:acetyltransferase EpsM
MKKLIIIGGRGNGTVAASTVEDINAVKKEWEILGFLNDNETEINGFPVIGPINRETAQKFLKQPDIYFVYTLISPKNREKFKHKLLDLQIPRERFATIIHPTTVVSKFAKIGYGCSIQPFVSVGPDVEIGDHVQIYAQALIGHDSRLDNFSYVANNACIGAKVHLQEGAYLGTNCSTLEFITIGKWSLVGMGSVVLKSVADNTKVVGNPAREIGKVE